MNAKELYAIIQHKKSFLCVGLDTDIDKIPKHLLSEPDPVFAFNKQIIDATHDIAVAYKPNLAFYESMGLQGWQSLQKTMDYIHSLDDKQLFTIADAKRGDIGNTSTRYAKAFFESFAFDSVTIAPYMGEDSVKPFLTYPNKWAIVLGLTSNKGAEDFQHFTNQEGEKLYEQVLKKVASWGTTDNIMFVVGATQTAHLAHIRSIVPNHFLLVPGVGAQGGSIAEVAKYGMNKQVGLLVNASRSILYAGDGKDFATAARKEALALQQEMNLVLSV